MNFLDFISALIIFLNAGFLSAIVARFTGANMTILILCSLLYAGAAPLEAAGIMMTFIVFMRLTMYTQHHPVNYKEFQIFRGWRLAIPVVLILAGLFFYPFAALAIFLAFFISELLYRIYHEMPKERRMAPSALAGYAAVASVITAVSFAVVSFIPETWYYGIAGTAILLLCVFFWWVGQNRRRLAGTWDTVILASFIPAGLFGFDLSDWIEDMRRSTGTSRLAYNLPFIVLPAFFVGFVAANVLFGIFSFSGLILTFFAALAIRLFGYYQMSGRGKTNLVAIAVTTLAAVCLFLTAPEPANISHVIDVVLPAQPVSDLFQLF